jgi:hypothetical protein
MSGGDSTKSWFIPTPVPWLPVVELTANRWNTHIVERHGEMAGLHSEVMATLESPTHVVTGNPGTRNVVFVNQGTTKSGGQPLVVVVNEPGAFVCTALYDRRFLVIAPERIRWLR